MKVAKIVNYLLQLQLIRDLSPGSPPKIDKLYRPDQQNQIILLSVRMLIPRV